MEVLVFFYLALAFCLAFAIIYLVIYTKFISGWQSIKTVIYLPVNEYYIENRAKFSIIIPARNEEDNIGKCLQSILQQTYPPYLYEIIVVDDFSEDRTASVVESVAASSKVNITLLSLADFVKDPINSYKKFGISKAVEVAGNEWIITTDADCTVPEKWLESIANFISDYQDAVFISGPVKYAPLRNFWHKILALELMGLVGIGGAGIANNSPSMCNGANLIYRKKAFERVNGFQHIDHIASGDDELLLHKLHNAFPGRIYFLKSRHAVVSTAPPPHFRYFLQQRKRWVSKSRYYSNGKLKRMMAAAYMVHLLVLINLVACFFSPIYLLPFFLIVLAKSHAELQLLQKVCKDLGEEKLVSYYFLALPFQTLYVVFIGIYGNFGTYNWKGRSVR